MDDHEKMTAIERLERELNEKDAELEELQERLQEAEEKAEADWNWAKHREYKDPKTAPNPELPVPRLEMRWVEQEPKDGFDIRAEYSLVYRHLLGHIIFVPLGVTLSAGALAKRVDPDGFLDTPFRDGAHFYNEIRQLKLPGFIIVGDRVEEVKFCPRCGRGQSGHRGPGQVFGPRCTLPPL